MFLCTLRGFLPWLLEDLLLLGSLSSPGAPPFLNDLGDLDPPVDEMIEVDPCNNV